MSSSDWTLITVTFNSAEHLRSSWSNAHLGSSRWIVVDNASRDDSAIVARALGAEVLSLPRNIGFAAANNIGLKRVRSQWVAFMNPDVTVANACDLDRLAAISVANGGLVSPQLLNTDGSVQPNARGLPFVLDKLANRSLPIPGSRLHDYARRSLLSPTYVAWTMGAAVAGATETFRLLDGWDERYFLYYEDHDLGLRAWRAGVPVVLDPQVRWQHIWARATSRPSLKAWRHEVRSGLIFYASHPDLLARRLHNRAGQYGELARSLWRPAVDVSYSSD